MPDNSAPQKSPNIPMILRFEDEQPDKKINAPTIPEDGQEIEISDKIYYVFDTSHTLAGTRLKPVIHLAERA